MYRLLDLSKNTIETRISPNKPTIKIVIRKISNSLEMAMFWIIDASTKEKLPRSLLFCKSIKDASSMYAYIVTEILDCRVVELFHSETPRESKDKIIVELKKSKQ